MFKIIKKSGKARAGILKTKSGKIETPFFMPVATKAAPKYLSFEDFKKIGFNCFICNSFLLYLKPSLEVIEKNKGLHKFINWKKSIFTDSGGFQALSLNHFNSRITDSYLEFKSPYDGLVHKLTPKLSMEIQEKLGVDVAMCLDHMPLHGKTKKETEIATNRTFLWAKQCLEYHKDKKQLLFGICQGGIFKDLREKSAKEIGGLNFDGFAIGGLAVGESKEEMFKMIDTATNILPEEKPRYVMGLGSPREIIKAVTKGVDIFDSIWPTLIARHGKLMTKKGYINLENCKYKNDLNKIEKNCKCELCKNYSLSYLHHLFKAKEPLAKILATKHNLYFMKNLMKEIRKAIKIDRLKELEKEYLRL
jgi:queuine tRNA-ribosyltransferase